MDRVVKLSRCRFAGLPYSQLLGGSFLAASFWWVYRELEIVIGASKITGSISWEQDGNAVLTWRLASFAIAVLLAHVALGILAWGLASDSMLRKIGSSREIWDSLWGHGTSVMSAHQFNVLPAMRAFGRAQLPGDPAVHAWPVALEDVRLTLQEFATGRAPKDVDGFSLLPFPAGDEDTAGLESRVRYTETCFNTLKLLEGKISPEGLVDESTIYYQMVPDTGWVQLRPERLHEVMPKKQRAALSRDSLLAAIPSWTDATVTYHFSSRRSPLPGRLAGPPDRASDVEATRLWDALHARFPGELPVESDLPRM